MKYLLIIQGEGRGHMTQAISLAAILRNNGHEISSMMVGTSSRREIPKFFIEKSDCQIHRFRSPNFVVDKKQKSVKLLPTVLKTLLDTPKFLRSLGEIDQIVKELSPDAIINFYDFIGGLYNFFYRPKAAFYCIAHQYLAGHSEFQFPSGKLIQRQALIFANKVSALGAKKVLALSFRNTRSSPDKHLYVVPPLIREEIKQLVPNSGNHLLAYVVNPGYGEDIKKFHEQHAELEIHCFWDREETPSNWKTDDKLTFHKLNDGKFMSFMASCDGYACTSGFESICEALYLGKPTMVVPVKGHYEQECNSIDAQKNDSVITSNSFDLHKLIDFIPKSPKNTTIFKKWVDSAGEHFLKHLT